MFEAHPHRYLVDPGRTFRIHTSDTVPPDGADGRKKQRRRLGKLVERFSALQHRLYAEDRHALLLVFQAMDAAGKDSTIRAVLSGVNPTGCQVFSFKQPSGEELDHDFLWRTARRLPERGRIGVFNRSHYEEVLVVRVHPEYLGPQRLPTHTSLETLWEERFASIRDHEAHLARNGTLVLKFFLNVSRDEQARRFASRLSDPRKHWKFSERDVDERAHWASYMQAYEEAIGETSKPWAPWYVIPADDKPYMRATVAEIIVGNLERIEPEFPPAAESDEHDLEALRRSLLAGEI